MVGSAHGERFSLPTGTVTFLLSDVEGSSQSWETAPEAMAVAIPRHYALLDEAIAAHGGVRPVEQGEGDSVVAAFSRALDAIATALDIQRAFCAEEWPEGARIRVRIAIHTGEAQLRDAGNYFGRTVIRCARLRAIGHGGQVLVSDVSAGLAAAGLPAGAELVDLGVHRLRDLGRPERVWQLKGPGLGVDFVDFPALRSMDAFVHNLPVQLTPLIGRDREASGVARRVEEDRLLTLTGSGGVGKTRLALAVAAEMLERFPGGVWLVELGGLTRGDDLAASVLSALGGQQESGVNLVAQVSGQLGGERSLLVLDNCEHLIEASAEFVSVLLAANATVTVLATSREPLGVPGEVNWRVPSLEVPPAEPALAVASLTQYGAVRLFIDRARRARPSFTVTEANAPAVAQICSRLDGIPLALELAAARCRQLSAERIAHDIDDRFRFLTGGSRTVLPRHQTLAASIEWSHSRLERHEAIAFRRLGVFAGPFPLEAAEAVVATLGDIDEVSVFDLVSKLVDKSLVSVEDDPAGEPRYRLLETLRTYAANEAAAAGEFGDLRRIHARWWLSWLERRAPALHTDPIVDQVQELHDNFKAALDSSLDDPAAGLRLLHLLSRPWQSAGRPGEIMVAVDHLLTEENAAAFPREWLRAVNATAALVISARGPAALPLVQAGERLAAEIDDQTALTFSQWLQTFSPELSARLQRVALEEGDRYLAAMATMTLANANALADPQAAAAQLNSPELHAASRECSYIADYGKRVRALAAFGTGDLAACIDLCRQLSQSRSAMIVDHGIYTLTRAALLAVDESQLAFAAEVATRRLQSSAVTTRTVELATARLQLLRGGPPTVDPDLRLGNPGLGPIDLYVSCREAIDAGASELAVETVRACAKTDPHGQAVLAAIEALTQRAEDNWQDCIHIAGNHGLRLLAADAL